MASFIRGTIMGNTPSIENTAPQTPRQPAPRPQNPQPIFAGVLGETAETLVPYDQAPPSSTVTPLPKDADIVVMAPGMAKTCSGQTAAALSRKGRLVQRVVFGQVQHAKGLAHRGQVKCTISGIDSDSALAWAIRSHVGETDV